jgi:hypothetical protein
MALHRGAISGHVASGLFARLRQRVLRHTATDEAVIACYIACYSKIDLANTTPEKARAHNIRHLF